MPVRNLNDTNIANNHVRRDQERKLFRPIPMNYWQIFKLIQLLLLLKLTRNIEETFRFDLYWIVDKETHDLLIGRDYNVTNVR